MRAYIGKYSVEPSKTGSIRDHVQWGLIVECGETTSREKHTWGDTRVSAVKPAQFENIAKWAKETREGRDPPTIARKRIRGNLGEEGGDCCQSKAISQNNARGALEGRLASGATTKGNRITKLNIIGYKSLTKKGGAQAHPRREAWNSVIGGKEVLLIKMGNINELKIRFGIRSYGFWSIGYFTDMGRFWNTVIYDLFLDLSIGLVSGS